MLKVEEKMCEDARQEDKELRVCKMRAFKCGEMLSWVQGLVRKGGCVKLVERI